MFCSRCTRAIKSRQRWAFSLSRLPVGSSASRTEGLLARLRAIATRCLSPPDSLAGKWLSRCSNPTDFNKVMARTLRSEIGRSLSNIGICTFSSAVNVGRRWNAWKMNPTSCDSFRITRSAFALLNRRCGMGDGELLFLRTHRCAPLGSNAGVSKAAQKVH
jgi:hypothetical protein